MAVVTLQIDGQVVAVPAGTSLLAATRAAGLELPVLCHLDGLTPVGACRLCLVEIEGQGKLQPACTSEALEGQVVATDTADLRQWRRMAVELFFAEGNHVCAYCVASGACELQAMAVAVGMDHSRFQPRRQPLHPLQPLRAGLRRAGGGPCLGDRRAGPPLPPGGGVGPTLGRGRRLHLLRPLRRGLPHRRPSPQGRQHR